MTKATQKINMITRVVRGKAFHAVNPETGERVIAQPGEKVVVPEHTAKAFPNRLVAPEVVEAEEKVATAQKEAAEKEAAEEATKKVAEAQAQAQAQGQKPQNPPNPQAQKAGQQS